MTDGEPQRRFDLAAAGLRADSADVEQGFEVLAHKLELTLPECQVQRMRARLLSRRRRVVKIKIKFTDSVLTLKRSGDKFVGMYVSWGPEPRRPAGMLGLAEWIEALEDELTEQAKTREDARIALERLIGS